MDRDEDIAAFLPRPPMPAPARRGAAIAEALRRFDGGEAAPAAGPAREPARSWARRPYAGALAGAALVVLIGLPLAWVSFPEPAAGPGSGPEGAADEAAPPESADMQADAVAANAAADELSIPAEDEPVPAAPGGPPARKAGDASRPADAVPAGEPAGADDGAIVVTGSRIRHPNLESSVPITTVGSEEIAVTGARSRFAAPARRGDWNACTIEDPRRDLGACRSRIAPAAKGRRGRSDAQLADGLSRAWAGDEEAAIAAFDRAIALAPRSSDVYLNRGLAWRRRGDLDRALADLDRAVRFSPRAARFYFHRGLIRGQKGDSKGARADAERAASLDPRYAPLVR